MSAGSWVKCKLCGDVIRSEHTHDFKWCKCGEIFVDGGSDYLRVGAKTDINNVIFIGPEHDSRSD